MFFLSIPQVWHLVGTWTEQTPNETNLIGMSQLEFMMTIHSIIVPLLLVILTYIFLKVSKKNLKKVI